METELSEVATNPELAEFIKNLVVEAGALVGLTGLIGKAIESDKWRGRLLPWLAMLVSVGIFVLPTYIDITPFMRAIVFGGSVTGLYSVTTRNMRK